MVVTRSPAQIMSASISRSSLGSVLMDTLGCHSCMAFTSALRSSAFTAKARGASSPFTASSMTARSAAASRVDRTVYRAGSFRGVKMISRCLRSRSLAYTERGLIAPAVKCRGREYLRIIYGPGYTREDQMVRLRKRTVGRKMALALREFALGVESLEQFVQHASLRRVHQTAFGVLALESEPLDPRL